MFHFLRYDQDLLPYKQKERLYSILPVHSVLWKHVLVHHQSVKKSGIMPFICRRNVWLALPSSFYSHRLKIFSFIVNFLYSLLKNPPALQQPLHQFVDFHIYGYCHKPQYALECLVTRRFC